jgi:putative membrane protein
MKLTSVTAERLGQRYREPLATLWLQAALVGAWLLTMITIPILRWLLGEGALRWGVSVSVCLLVAAVLAILHQAWGVRRTARVVVPVVLLAWLLEYVGHTTGYPFGHYSYTVALQPQLGNVPLLIPLAWLMMLPPAWAVGSWLSGTDRGLRFVLVSAGAFTAWDLFLDPQMVAWGYWQWATPGGYFGIPWLNFGGWFLSSALITLVARPSALPIKPLLLIYIITWLLQSIGQALFWAMPGPALVGFLVMGSFVLLTIRRGRW